MIRFDGDWRVLRTEFVGDRFFRVLGDGDAVVRLDRPDRFTNPIEPSDRWTVPPVDSPDLPMELSRRTADVSSEALSAGLRFVRGTIQGGDKKRQAKRLRGSTSRMAEWSSW